MSTALGAVELDAVVKRFGGVTAVDHIDLAIRAGEFLSLLGPSGCGKTTTLRMLAGFEEPDDGRITVSGQDVLRVPPHKRDINTVFQHYALFPHMSVAENVAFGLRQKHVDKADVGRRVGEALEMVKMTQFARRRPRQLSGGQQQRVALARALVNRPAVLLLDEPLGALDRKLRQEMQIELKLLQSQVGITFVYVTHDQEEALSMSDRIAVIRDGHIEQLDVPDVVYDEPASAFVAGFIGQQNFFDGTARDEGREVVGDGWVARTSRPVIGALNGGPVVAAIRPESVMVAAGSPTADVNTMRGTLVGIAHLGDVLQYVVRTGTDREVLARLRRERAPRLSVGEPVHCIWDDDAVHVFGGDKTALGPGVLAGPDQDTNGGNT